MAGVDGPAGTGAGVLGEEAREKTDTFRIVVRAGSVVATAALLVSVVLQPGALASHFPYAVVVLDHLIALAVLRARGTRAAVAVFAVLYFIGVAGALYLGGGAGSPTASVLLPLVLLVGLTWNGWAALVVAAAGSLLVLVFSLLESRGVLPGFQVDDNPLRLWMVTTASLVVTAAILSVALATIRRSRARAADSERAALAMQAALTRSRRLEAIGRLAAGVAHDFNNVLTVILSEASGITAEAPPAVGDKARAIESAGNRAASLTRQLLAFARRQVLEPQVVDLNAVVRELGSLLGRMVGGRFTVVQQLGAGLPPISVDRSQLEQVVMNLVANAGDAMAGRDGGQVTIRTGGGPVGVWLAVEDQGGGIDPAVADRIFEPFFTTKGRGKGSGLGLATVQGIVVQSGGEIAVRSVPGQGSVFTVTFPAARAALPAAAPPVEGPARSAGGRALVLLCDDDDLVRAATRAVLESGRHEVHEVRGPAELMPLAERLQRAPDLLLTDVIMPSEPGPELARRLRARFPGVRVLFMSGYSDDQIAREGVIAPGVHLIRKPFNRAELLHKVDAVLGSTNPGALGPPRTTAAG
jgi:two-component system cell cycle sensor histidine kinase/response regulator CckA